MRRSPEAAKAITGYLPDHPFLYDKLTGGELLHFVGGLYGIRIGGLFAGESMFHAATDASKVALVALVDWLRDTGATLLDVQWTTPHLTSLGAIDVPRAKYLELLADAVARPGPRLATLVLRFAPPARGTQTACRIRTLSIAVARQDGQKAA